MPGQQSEILLYVPGINLASSAIQASFVCPDDIEILGVSMVSRGTTSGSPDAFFTNSDGQTPAASFLCPSGADGTLIEHEFYRAPWRYGKYGTRMHFEIDTAGVGTMDMVIRARASGGYSRPGDVFLYFAADMTASDTALQGYVSPWAFEPIAGMYSRITGAGTGGNLRYQRAPDTENLQTMTGGDEDSGIYSLRDNADLRSNPFETAFLMYVGATGTGSVGQLLHIRPIRQSIGESANARGFTAQDFWVAVHLDLTSQTVQYKIPLPRSARLFAVGYRDGQGGPTGTVALKNAAGTTLLSIDVSTLGSEMIEYDGKDILPQRDVLDVEVTASGLNDCNLLIGFR